MAEPQYGQIIGAPTPTAVGDKVLPTFGQPIIRLASFFNLPVKGQIIIRRIG